MTAFADSTAVVVVVRLVAVAHVPNSMAAYGAVFGYAAVAQPCGGHASEEVLYVPHVHDAAYCRFVDMCNFVK